MGEAYAYLWAVFVKWWMLVTVILFGIDKAAEWFWSSYRAWLNETFLLGTRRKFLWWTVLVFVFVSGFLAWRDEHFARIEAEKDLIANVAGAVREEPLKFATVNKDGVILAKRDFGEYGLFVKKTMEKVEGEEQTVYMLKFSKEPDYFEVASPDGATTRVERIGVNEHKLMCILRGFGDAVVACNFTVKVF